MTKTAELPGVFRLGQLEVTEVGHGGGRLWTAVVCEVASPHLLVMEVFGRTEEEADARAAVIVAAYNEELVRRAGLS